MPKRDLSPIRYSLDRCSFGTVLVAASEGGVCALFLGDKGDVLVQDLRNRFPGATLIDEPDTDLKAVADAALELIETPGLKGDLVLDLHGTSFQKEVWRALCEIPAGTTVTYLQLAERVGRPKAFRAVAQACGANPVAILVPCHRVVGSDGALSGYRWGVERKRMLLERETKLGICG